MTEVNVQYCVPCGLLEPAMRTQEALLEEFGQDLDAVRLQTGHGGVFRVHADGDLVWDTDNHDGEIDLEFIIRAVDDRIDA